MIKELTDAMVGKPFSCCIKGNEVKRCTIQKEGAIFYICQDICEGTHCKDKRGFKHSWLVGNGSGSSLRVYHVTNLRRTSLNTLEAGLREGDIICKKGSTDRIIVGTAGQAVFFTTSVSRSTSLTNLASLDQCGWTIKPEEEEVIVEELTMEQLCKELGREVKIKK